MRWTGKSFQTTMPWRGRFNRRATVRHIAVLQLAFTVIHLKGM